MLDIDCHCEAIGLQYVFLIDSHLTDVVISGFSYKDHRCYASRSVLACVERIGRVELQAVQFEIAFFLSAECHVLAQPEKWSMTGSYSSSSRRAWNANNAFHGMLCIGHEVQFRGLANRTSDGQRRLGSRFGDRSAIVGHRKKAIAGLVRKFLGSCKLRHTIAYGKTSGFYPEFNCYGAPIFRMT